MRNVVINISLSFVTVVIFLALVEIGSHVYLKFVDRKDLLTRWEFRLTRPDPYRDADYFSKNFVYESMKSGAAYRPPGVNFLVHENFTGKYFNIVNGRRVTTDQPSSYTSRVLMFGGSSLFSQEVPDWETIASHLQRFLNAGDGPSRVVENYGTNSMVAAQQTERLTHIPIHPGDFVIFYDGVNEIYYPVYSGYRTGYMPGMQPFRPIHKLNWYQRALHAVFIRYREHSAAVDLFLDIYDRAVPTTINDPHILESNLAAADVLYYEALVSAHHYVEQRGGRFYHFLQPNVFTLEKRSPYEETLIANYLQTPPGLEAAFRRGYPRLRAAIAAARAEGVASFDISHVLDKRAPGEELYLDFAHVNDAANKRIAQRIYEIVFVRSDDVSAVD